MIKPDRAFFEGDTVALARRLLGCTLWHAAPEGHSLRRDSTWICVAASEMLSGKALAASWNHPFASC